jgi:hypothetical protein
MKVSKAIAKRWGLVRFHAPSAVPGWSLSVSMTPPPGVKVRSAAKVGAPVGVTWTFQVPTMGADRALSRSCPPVERAAATDGTTSAARAAMRKTRRRMTPPSRRPLLPRGLTATLRGHRGRVAKVTNARQPGDTARRGGSAQIRPTQRCDAGPAAPPRLPLRWRSSCLDQRARSSSRATVRLPAGEDARFRRRQHAFSRRDPGK